MKFSCATAILAIASAALVAPTFAQSSDYPTRPIRMIVGYPPGGATDVMARAVGARLSERLKQPVVIENRAGASGQIGADHVAKATPDGYTLLFTAADTNSINPHVYPKIPYDGRKDFTPVAMVGNLVMSLIVHPSVQAKNVNEFVELARKAPGKLNVASYGMGSSSHVALEMFKQHAKIDVLHVPFQGAAPAVQATIGGQVDGFIVPLPVSVPNHRSNRVRLLGVASPERFPSAQDLPTFKEQGMDLNLSVWIGILGPAGMPKAIAERINAEVKATIADEQVREALVKHGLAPQSMNVAEFTSYLDTEYERWGRVVRAANIRLD